MDTLSQDLRQALRTLWKSPGFAAAAILTLALGIGVNIAVFTVFHAALLASLPVREPGRLVQISTWTPQNGDHFDFSYPLYVDLRDGNDVLSDLIATTSEPVGVSAGSQSERVISEFVTSNYFHALGVDLAAGAGFSGEDELRGGPARLVVSHALWRGLLGGDASAIGKTILVNGRPYPIAGIAPRGFEGLVRGQRADLWLSVAQYAALGDDRDYMGLRRSSWLDLVGRLKPGVTAPQAADRLTTLARRADREEAGEWSVRVRPAATGNTSLVESLESPLQVLTLVVGFILVIAAANVANLLLARLHARQQEIAVRQAIGATRARIVQQLLTEGFTLAIAGGALGLLVASWIVALFELRTPGAASPLALKLEPDPAVVGFAALLSVVSAAAAGLMPALMTSRPDLLVTIKGAGDAPGGVAGKRRLRSALAVVQIALSLVLVVGAGLFLRTLAKLRDVDPAIVTDRVVAATVNLTLRGYDETRGRRFYADVLDRLRRAPGVESASLAFVLPATAGGRRIDVAGAATVPKVDGQVSLDVIPVSDGFFATSGIPLLRGRDFDTRDAAGAANAVIVNEQAARRFWPAIDPVGQTLTIVGEAFEVVGVARNTKYRSLREQSRMSMYVPIAQSYVPAANVLVRSALPPVQTIDTMRAQVRQIDPAMPLYNTRTLAEHVSRSLYLDRLRAELISWLAALAVALAAIGIYGVVSYGVAERTREVGIRLALGAQPGAVLRMMLAAGARLAGVGILGGLLLSLWLTRLVAAQLFGVSRTDAATLAGACALMFAIILLAAFVPARRATRIDPIAALRHD